MWRNNLVIGLRSLLKHRFFTLINTLGLSIGVACAILIGLYVQQELGYDAYNSKANRLYRLKVDLRFGDMDNELVVVPPPAASAFLQDFPEVVAAVRFRERGPWMVRPANTLKQNLQVGKTYYADSSMMDVFDMTLISGLPQAQLRKPNSLMLAKSLAVRLFGTWDVAGKQVQVDDDSVMQDITGVFEDFPVQSHFHPNILFAMAGLPESREPSWLSHNFQTYILLRDGADPKALSAKFPAMVSRYVLPQIKQYFSADVESLNSNGDHLDYYLQPLTDIHLQSSYIGEFEPGGDARYVWVFGSVGIFILLIACVNFINLSTARATGRAREVGIRKTLGSGKTELVIQFLTESIMVSVVSVFLGFLLAWLSVPVLNQVAGSSISIPFQQANLWFSLIGLTLVIGVLAGAYPSFYMAGFPLIDALKGKIQSGKSAQLFRSVLVVFQFAISIALVISTVIVNRQMNFLQNRKLGFDKDQLLVVEDVGSLRSKAASFQNEVSRLPGVTHTTRSSFLPVVGENNNNTIFWPEGKKNVESQVIMTNWRVDFDYVETLGMEMVAGRAFSKDFPTDSQAMILNETAVRTFGLTDPVGTRIITFGGEDENGQPIETPLKVIGVVKDFDYHSVNENVTPLCLMMGFRGSYQAIKVSQADARELVKGVEAAWKKVAPSQPFNYFFADDKFDRMVRNETKVGEVFAAFSLLAIFIACLGLFALAAFMVERRAKEISVRKILGSSSYQIVGLFSREFMLLVGIALLLATPIGLYLMQNWLEGFVFRINFLEVSAIAVGSAGLLSGFIALATVSSTAIRAAMANPAQNLRSE